MQPCQPGDNDVVRSCRACAALPRFCTLLSALVLSLLLLCLPLRAASQDAAGFVGSDPAGNLLIEPPAGRAVLVGPQRLDVVAQIELLQAQNARLQADLAASQLVHSWRRVFRRYPQRESWVPVRVDATVHGPTVFVAVCWHKQAGASDGLAEVITWPLDHFWATHTYEVASLVTAAEQSVPSNCQFFVMKSQLYLFVAVARSPGGSLSANSKLFVWQSTRFTEAQTLATQGAQGATYFSIGSLSLLAVANQRNPKLKINSELFLWDGSNFQPNFQLIPTAGAHDWVHFVEGNRTFLAWAGNSNDTTSAIHGEILEWNPAKELFEPFQTFPTDWAKDVDYIVVSSNAAMRFLLVGNAQRDSALYRWTGQGFALHQPLDASAFWRHVPSWHGQDLLISSSGAIYTWNPATLLFDKIPAEAPIRMDSNPGLLLASNAAFLVASDADQLVIYRMG